MGAASSWTFDLPVEGLGDGIAIGGNTVIATNGVHASALDARTGRLLWKTSAVANAFIDGDRVLLNANTNGDVEARDVRSGRIHWRAHLCPWLEGYNWGGIAAVSTQRALVVGCTGGNLMILDRSSGRVLHRNSIPESNGLSIEPIGPCAYAVAGVTDGATLVNHLAIFDCRNLDTIMEPRDDTSVVGAIGDVAIVDDWCCFGRPDVYRPASIFRVDLTKHHQSPEVDLTPEPQLYPSNQRPIGQGSRAFVIGKQLYLQVDHVLYDYGDPRDGYTLRGRVMDNLIVGPAPLPDGHVVVQRSYENNRADVEIGDFNGLDFTVIYRYLLEDGQMPWFRPEIPAMLMQGHEVIRLVDGARARFGANCTPRSVSGDLVISTCTTHVLVGNRYKQYLEATFF